MTKAEDELARRREKNKSLLERVERGESVSLIPPSATHYPPRPVIKKDRALVEKLYRLKPEKPDDK
jgi:hypothetical protein